MYQTRGWIDFVVDCGADPSGATDCQAAWESARTQLLALGTAPLPGTNLTLYFPPGLYRLKSALTHVTWDFTGKGTALRLVGAGGDASILSFEGGAGVQGPTIANMLRVSVEDLCFYGYGTGSSVDCYFCLALNPTDVGTVQRCRFQQLWCSEYAIQLGQGQWSMRDCVINGCSSADAAKAVVWSNQTFGTKLDNCKFVDVGTLNGNTGASKVPGSGAWFRHDDCYLGNSMQNQQGIVIENCLFDENPGPWCVRIIGGPTARIPYVRMAGIFINTPDPAGGCCIDIQKVDTCIIEHVEDSEYGSSQASAAVNLVDVNHATLRRIVVNPAKASNFVSADSACKVLEVIDSPTIIVNSSATITTVEVNGVKADLYTSGAAITQNYLCKMTAAGTISMLAAADLAGVVIGPCLDTCSAAAKPARAARIGQPVTMISDGAVAIAVGDRIVPSALTAGCVKKSAVAGTGTVGIALSSAVAVAGTAFQVNYSPSII